MNSTNNSDNQTNSDATNQSEQNNHSNNNSSKPYRASRFKIFFASLAGYDLKLLPEYCNKSLAHEENRLVWIGASVFIPAFFGFCGASFNASTHIDTAPYKYYIGAIFAVILFFIDSLIVRTLVKEQILSAILRMFASVCIGIVVSEPVILMAYSDTITAEIHRKLNEDESSDNKITKTNSDIEKKEIELNDIPNKINEVSKELDKFSIANIKTTRLKEEEARINQLSKEEKSKNEGEILALRKELDDNKTKLKTLNDQIEQVIVKKQLEFNGKGVTGKSGIGSMYTQLELEVKNLNQQRQPIADNVIAVQNKISQLQRNSENFSFYQNKFIVENNNTLLDFLRQNK